MNKKTLFLLLSFFTATETIAHPVQGPGAASCAQFAKMYRENPQIEWTFYNWALGFWSATNLAVSANGKNQQRDPLATMKERFARSARTIR